MPALSGNSLEIRSWGKQRALCPILFFFFFSFARQKKGSGFFFCAKHAPALRAAGAAALRACSPAPPAARPRRGPGPSLGCRSAPAAPLLAPGRPSSGCSCSVLVAPSLCFHSTLQKLLPRPSSSLHALPARFCPHPKTGTCKPSPPFPAKPWMPAAGPGISRAPCSPFWLLEAFSRRLCIVQKKTPPVAPLGLVLQAAITPTTTLQPLGAGLKDPSNLALSQ